jgi:hypothetical protein
MKVFYLLEISFAVEQLETDILITRLLAKTPVGARDPKLGFWFTKIPLSPEKNYGFSPSVCPTEIKMDCLWLMYDYHGQKHVFIITQSAKQHTHNTMKQHESNMRGTS